MAIEDIFKGGNIITGLALAVGTAVLAPVIGPAVGAVLRPAAKAAIKGGIVAYDWTRSAAAQVGEVAGDMAAEARAEVQTREPATATSAMPSNEAAPA